VARRAAELLALRETESPQQGGELASREAESATAALAAAVLAVPPAASYLAAPARPRRTASRPKRLEIVEGLETPAELRVRSREFLAACDTLAAKREAQEKLGKGTQSAPHLHGGRDGGEVARFQPIDHLGQARALHPLTSPYIPLHPLAPPYIPIDHLGQARAALPGVGGAGALGAAQERSRQVNKFATASDQILDSIANYG